MKTDDTSVYIKCMEKVKQRIAVIRWLNSAKPPLGTHTMLTTELTFVQFRKILELIAFASLTSNREKYAEARADFGMEWNAKRILKNVEELNPHFYPIPMTEPKMDLIRFGGHLPKGGYDVRNGRNTKPAPSPAVHG